MPLWITAGCTIIPRSKTTAHKKLSRQSWKSHLIANDIQCLQTRIKTDTKTCKIEKLFIVFAV